MNELIRAIANGSNDQDIQEIIQQLQAKGTALNAMVRGDVTVAHIAALFGHAGAIAALQAAGVDLNAQDRAGSTPAHLAAAVGQAGAIAALRAAGANLSAANVAGDTPAHLAAAFGQAGAIVAMGDARAVFNAQNNAGDAPAHLAARRGVVAVVEALRDAGISLDVPNAQGWTPATLAAANGHTALAEAISFYPETTLMGQVTAALEGSADQSHRNLAADLTCPIMATPYTSRGDTRPVRLPDSMPASAGVDTEKRPLPGSVLSAAAAFRCMQPEVAGDYGRPPPSDPMTRRVFSEAEAHTFLHSPGFLQGDPARLALVAAVGEACGRTDRSPQALIAAATAASAAQAAAAVAAPAPRDFRAILDSQSAGAAAGAGGGAASPRSGQGGPVL